MTPCGSNFNDFPENQLPEFVQFNEYLTQIGSGSRVLLFKARET